MASVGEKRPVLVTGARGNLGGATITALLARDLLIRAGVRDLRAPVAHSSRVDPVRLDFLEPATFAPALAGCRAVFLVRPPAIARVQQTVNRFIDAAAEAGVGHVVFSSVEGADANRFIPHHRIEQHLMSSGLSWTVLRPGFFAQNLTGAYRTDIARDSRLFVPASAGRVAFLDVTDLGEVAAHVIADPTPHLGEAYTLTGPQALTFTDVAALLTSALDRHVRYDPATPWGYISHLRAQNLPLAQVLVQTVLHLGLRRGASENVDPSVERLLGRPATPMSVFIDRHRDCWRWRE